MYAENGESSGSVDCTVAIEREEGKQCGVVFCVMRLAGLAPVKEDEHLGRPLLLPANAHRASDSALEFLSPDIWIIWLKSG